MIRHIGVVVPAADEEDRIAACLDSLARASHQLITHRPGVSVHVVVVLDDCRDGTAGIVAGRPLVRVAIAGARCVGAARAIGTALATDVPQPAEEIWTAHTDADSQVPAEWLTTMVAAADAGVDLVLGTVTPGAELSRSVRHAWEQRHRLRDGHPHVHGANLGIRAATLRQLGGWRSLDTGEDADLAARAAAAGVATRRTGAIAVHTSARADGRAPHGFSSYLRALSTAPAADSGRRSVTQ